MSTFFIIVVIIAILLFLMNKNSQNYVEDEVRSLGGMKRIFINLHFVLLDENFELHLEEARYLEYRHLINQYSYIKFVVRRSINPKEPYDMQMFFLTSGEMKAKTLPYLVVPDRTEEQFREVLFKMANELSIKQSQT